MQNKPNLLNAQMNVTSLITVDYENIANRKLGENKANTKPIKPNTMPIQTQSNPTCSELVEPISSRIPYCSAERCSVLWTLPLGVPKRTYGGQVFDFKAALRFLVRFCILGGVD